MTAAEIEAIARRVAELLAETVGRPRPDANRLLSAAEVATRLGRSRDWVYDHADDLGAIRLGTGPRPRLAFDPQTLDDWATRRIRRRRSNASVPRSRSGMTPRRSPGRPEGLGKRLDLLPIARSNGVGNDKKRPRDVAAPGARQQEENS